MSLSDLAALGSFISGFAVLISLIFLYFQLRQVNAQVIQTEKNQRALMNQGAITRVADANMWLMQPHVFDVFFNALSQETELSDREVLQTSIVFRVILGNAQDVYVQHAAGLLDQITFDGVMNSFQTNLGNPIFRAMWKFNRTNYSPEWMSFVDRLVEETPLRPRPDWVTRFKATLDEVIQ